LIENAKTLLDYTPSTKRRIQPAIGDYSWVNKDTPLGNLNLNWKERDLPERLRTKHVHRLHPYLGKYVPQLVEILLRKFAPKIVCDPFCGSGTTLVEANALNIESIGCDISAFNCLMTKVKTDRYDVIELEREIKDILSRTFSAAKFTDLPEKLIQKESSSYLKQWFHTKALGELLVFRSMIENYDYQDVLKIILSRSARSARLTTHFDLDFPKRPQTAMYYCFKHRRTCRPTNSALEFLQRYGLDTTKRIREFSRMRTNASINIICGDSRKVEFPKCDAIMTSPPYVGLIDYHEQHRYAYELLDLPDNRDHEIGPASRGTSKQARQRYIEEIGSVLRNVRRNQDDKGIAVIVVHDKSDLYSGLAEKTGFKVDSTLVRNVNRRTGRRSSEFFEQILIWKAA
jgi:site-specific DNA-adenine methylase